VPVTNGIARCLGQRLLSDPMQQIDVRKNAHPVSLGRAFETASILVVLLCLFGLLIHATLADTTVVVAAPPPGAEAVGSVGGGAPAP
jgi:hypothetical protein